MRCSLCCAAAVLLLAVSCSTESPGPVNQASVAARAPRTAEAPAQNAGTAATDPFHEEYAALWKRIARWDGDPERLKEPRQQVMAIIGKDRKYAPAYVALARIEAFSGFKSDMTFESEALDRGSKFVSHALKLDASNFDAHCTAALIATLRGDYDVAEESLRRADELKPGHAAVKVIRASIASEQNEPLTAVKLAREVIAESTDDDLRAMAYDRLIEAYVEGSHLEQADAAFKEVLKLRSDSAWIHSTYAFLLLNRDDVDGAVREAEAAAKIRDYPFGKAVLALSYLAKGQQLWDAKKIVESTSFVQKVADLSSDNAHVAFRLGEFYERAAVRSRDASLRKKALASYKRALEINPQNMDAERAVERLERRAG